MTIVAGRHAHLARQRAWAARLQPAPDRHVVVVMGGPDPAPVLAGPGVPVVRLDVPTDGPLPLAAARNRGVARAVALGADVVVLLDVDVLPLPDLVTSVVRGLAARPGDVLLGQVRYLREGVAPDGPAAWDDARPDPRAARLGDGGATVPPELLWSLLLAVTPATWTRLGGFHEGYVGYGAEDTDLGMVAAARGVGLAWSPTVRGLHQWHGTGDRATRAADLVRNATTFHRRWGWWPMAGWLAELDEAGLVRFDAAADVCELAGPAPGRTV